MPHIAIMMYPGRSEEVKEALAKEMQEAIMKAMNAPANVFSVSIEEVAPENWNETVAAKVAHDDIYIASDFVK